MEDATLTIVKSFRGHLSRKSHSDNEIEVLISSVMNYGPEKLVIWLFNHEHPYFNSSFLLCFPEIWNGFSKNNWENIFRAIVRPKNIRLLDEVGNFDDILFLYRYIGIDSISWISSVNMPDDDRNTILNHFKIRIKDLIPNKYDSANFKDGTWVSKSVCSKYRDVLMINGLKPAIYTVQDISRRIESCLFELNKK